MRIHTGWVLAFLSILLYSTNSPVARAAILAGIAPTTLLAARFALASALFGFSYPLFAPRIKASAHTNRPFDRRAVILTFVSGVLNGLSLYFLYQSLAYVGAALSSMLMIGIFPIFTLIILALGGEKPTQRSWLRIVLGVSGLYFLLGLDSGANLPGVIFILLAALFFSLHIVSVQWYLSVYNTWMVTALLVFSASIIVSVIWLQSGMDYFVPGWIGWGAILFQAVMATYLGRLITYAAIKQVGSAQFALLSPLETLLTIFWSTLFLGENFTTAQGIGAVLILLGTGLAADQFRLRSRPEPPSL